ncbi:MAG: hypothetical protein V8R91_12040 [Butyricimonas faecihominis]
MGCVFTTHATVLGRSIAGNGLPLYDPMKDYNPVETAHRFGVDSTIPGRRRQNGRIVSRRSVTLLRKNVSIWVSKWIL